MHNALFFIEQGNACEAYGEIVFALEKAGELHSLTNHEVNTMIEFKATDKQSRLYGARVAINTFLNSIEGYDKFAITGPGGIVRLNGKNKSDYVAYVHLHDVIKCAKGVKMNL